ncbi:hypothetical protein ACFR9U_03890 [Halorientalis brevis]|uniref:Uncharacterized protein n=1 Tax=Halorientalis brevis TaxID=1126241 RepID=A0ABD6C8S1_9EURY|nr:hypothetical protein [Halorientalis brevis]
MTPGRVAGACAVGSGAVGFVLVAVGGLATLLGVAGLCGLAAGCYAGSRSVVTLGAVGLFLAVVAAGVSGVSGPSLVGASGAVLVAWTAGQTATELQSAFDGGTRTRRLELVHVAGTTLVGTGVVGIALVPRAITVDPSPLGTTLVLGGAVVLTAQLLGSTRTDGA